MPPSGDAQLLRPLLRSTDKEIQPGAIPAGRPLLSGPPIIERGGVVVSHVTEVAEGVHRLTNGVANFYLIQESGKLTLVDAGASKDWALFTRAAGPS